ncbi:MAG: glycosyltransferase family 4 protein, partial [Candidatus Cloacimonadota bacterium]|nr:glycosyltransferase family 4 protein [Candidatus Cloacimonadota bacterium]
MSKKCKILHLQLLPILSGVQNTMLTLLANLDPNKFDIFVASKPDGPLVEKVKELGFTYIPVKYLRRRFSSLDFFALHQLYFIFKSHNFDIVHTHSSKTGVLGRIAAKAAKVPQIVHTVHGFPFNDAIRFPLNQIYQIIEKFAAKLTDDLIFVNSAEKRFAIKNRFVKKDNCHTIHNGLDVFENFQKSKYEELENKTVIGFVGRFAFPKNVLTITKAAVYACRKNNNLGFIFVGDGPDWNECNRFVIDNKMEKNIKLVGWQNNIKKFLSYFDALVLFSKFEGLSISILEGMAAGLPIIASNVKGNNELVDNSNGFLIDIDRIDK